MGFLQRRRDRKLENAIGSEDYAQLMELGSKRDHEIAAGNARAERFAAEVKHRLQEIEASPVDHYFRGVLCFSVAGGADLLRAFGAAARIAQIEASEAEGPPDDLVPYLDAIETDESWGRALGVSTWAYACRFASINWSPQYDEVVEVIAAGLGKPSPAEERMIDAANFQEKGIRQLSAFHEAHFAASHDAALGRAPAPDAANYAWLLWPSAWNEGFDLLLEQLEHYFPDGPPEE